ncbi:monomeric sarcosine oxidase-like isoform X2 [Lineus longissimus]|uniref:monomeric sarcosine oxidase-like isoform X2 n=1 Tax=Lineus longissimus TaxID=88925 RepID=UPI00315D25A5
MSSFDYIVVGCGGIGSGAVYWLSKVAGKGVLGLEQFSIGHVRGGSQDYSRIIRHLYHDEMYTKLTQATYDTYEKLDGLGIRRYFPQWKFGAEMVGLYQRDGGLVDAASGNAAHIQLARGNGATVIDNCAVTGIRKLGPNNIQVTTNKGEFRCKRVIVTAGAWINDVLGSCGVHLPVTVTQEQVTYYATPHMRDFTKDKFPVFIYHGDSHDLYGLPIYGNTGTKMGIDVGGHEVTGDTRTWTPDPVRENKQEDFLKRFLPKFLGPILETRTCLYTMTPDRNFVVDNLARKGLPEVSFCCGAGHAYKFASLLGKILSQLAIDGRTTYDISKFSMEREAIADPNFPKNFGLGRVVGVHKAKL